MKAYTTLLASAGRLCTLKSVFLCNERDNLGPTPRRDELWQFVLHAKQLEAAPRAGDEELKRWSIIVGGIRRNYINNPHIADGNKCIMLIRSTLNGDLFQDIYTIGDYADVNED